MKRNILMLAASLLTLSAVPAASGSADATDPSTAVPSTVYKSPFSNYRPLGADQRIPWKAANEEVGRIGGWRVYAREAAAAATNSDKPTVVPVPISPKNAETAPTKSPHAGHAGHGEPKKDQP